MVDSDEITIEYGRVVINNLPTVNTLHEWFIVRDSIDNTKFYGCMTKKPRFRKDVIFHLVLTKTPFKSVHYGAGVYKILPTGKIKQ